MAKIQAAARQVEKILKDEGYKEVWLACRCGSYDYGECELCQVETAQ